MLMCMTDTRNLVIHVNCCCGGLHFLSIEYINVIKEEIFSVWGSSSAFCNLCE